MGKVTTYKIDKNIQAGRKGKTRQAREGNAKAPPKVEG